MNLTRTVGADGLQGFHTKQCNKRTAEQIEAAHKTSLAKGEVGIRKRAPVPTLKEFAERDFMPFTESRFQNKPKTLEYYKSGVKNITAFAPLASCPLDGVTQGMIAAFIAKKRAANLQVTSINRQLEVLRRMLKLAVEWGIVDKVPPRVEILPGEDHRDRVLSPEEEVLYLQATVAVGETGAPWKAFARPSGANSLSSLKIPFCCGT